MFHELYRQTREEVAPKVTVSFDDDDAGQFYIEELTFNPFITRNSLRALNTVEIWTELVIRLTSSATGDIPVPKVVLDFQEDFDPPSEPSCLLPGAESHPGTLYFDMNFLMHSDIWYSFVRLGATDREFMSRGYNQPTRLLYSCHACTRGDPQVNLHVNREQWIGGNSEGLQATHLSENILPLIRKINLFNQKAVHPPGTDHFFEPRTVQDPATEGSRTVLVPREAPIFAPVPFEYVDSLKGRFAVRRLPWKSAAAPDSRDFLYGINYGGTFIVSRRGRSFVLSPMLFSLDSPTQKEAILSPGEAVRFWIRWLTDNALSVDSRRERFSFRYSIAPRPRLHQFNTFFQVPDGFDHVPGGVTDLRHYAVPPKLFFVWPKNDTDSCFSFYKQFSTDEVDDIEVAANFYDKNIERRRLTELFIIGSLSNVSAGIEVALLFGGNSDRPRFIPVAPLLAIGLLLAAGARVYGGHRILWPSLLVALSTAAFLLPLVLKHPPYAPAAAIFAFLLLSLHAINKELVTKLARMARAPFQALAYRRQKRNFVRDIRQKQGELR